MAESFYTLELHCAECHKSLEPKTIRGVIYLHHEIYESCEQSDKYFFPPEFALSEAAVEPDEKPAEVTCFYNSNPHTLNTHGRGFPCTQVKSVT